MGSEAKKKLIFIIGIIALLVFVIRLVSETRNSQILNPEYENYVKKYRENIRNTVQKTAEKHSNEPDSRIRVTNNNFEGPQVSLVNVEHWGKRLNLNDRQTVLDYQPNFIKFDPDHPFLGLPDMEMRLSPVTLYQPGRGRMVEKLKNFLSRVENEEPKPYKTYTKTIIPPADGDSIPVPMAIEMQLWLLQFNLTVSAKPNRVKKNKVDLTDFEKTHKKYPGHWYQKSGMLTANDLDAEPKNNRYGNLKIWLQLKPDNAPWYVNNAAGMTEKPEMAIGAVYCMGVVKEPLDRPDDRINSHVIPGSELSLYSEPAFSDLATGISEDSPFDFGQFHGTSVSRNDTTSNSIWNKDYFVKVYLDNIGTWKEGLFKGKYDDQITYKFLMPVLVEGAWDVKPPFELIPKWNPPPPFQKKGLSVLPEWGLKFGKFISAGLLVLIGLAMAVMLIPGVLSSILKI